MMNHKGEITASIFCWMSLEGFQMVVIVVHPHIYMHSCCCGLWMRTEEFESSVFYVAPYDTAAPWVRHSFTNNVICVCVTIMCWRLELQQTDFSHNCQLHIHSSPQKAEDATRGTSQHSVLLLMLFLFGLCESCTVAIANLGLLLLSSPPQV